MEGAELLGAKVLGKNGSRKVSDIGNAKGLTGLRPEDDLGMIGGSCQQLGFALQHLVETAGELLWNSSLSRSGIMQGVSLRVDNGINRHDGGVCSEWRIGCDGANLR